MRITEIILHDVELPLVHSFETSSHRKTSLRHLLVEAVDESGQRGWGEIASPAGPYYASETTEVAWHSASTYLIPAVLGRQWDHPDEVSGFFGSIRGHWFAKAGVDMAAWTLFTAATATPLAQALGGTRESVVAGVSLGIEPSIDELLTQVDKHVAAGYPRVKLKIAPATGGNPGWDIEPVKAVRAAYPDLDVHVDANGAYLGTEDDFAVFQELDAYGLTMIEQPFAPRNFLDSARLQETLQTRSVWTNPWKPWMICVPPSTCEPDESSTSRSPAWAVSPQPGKPMHWPAMKGGQCGAGACTNSVLDG